MIKIQIANIDTIAKEFKNRIENSIVKNKLDSNLFSNPDELHKRISEMYLCEPSKLKSKHKEFSNYLNNIHTADIESIKSKYFDYESIIDYTKRGEGKHAYWLMNKLNVNVCPYCNRNYTFTIKNNRPQIDHFYCQESYPYLALSFYNLIPSCPVCNHIKKTEDIEIHPHKEGFGNDCKFQINKIEQCILGKDYDNWLLEFSPHDTKYDANIDKLKLIDFYNGIDGHGGHKDYISEIVFKAQAYNNLYYETLLNTFKNQGLTSKEMNLLIFGNYVELEDMNKRSLSKLTKDILEQLKMKY